MGIDSTIIEIVVVSDNLFHECFTLDYMPRSLYQIGEDQKLCFCHFDNFIQYLQKVLGHIKGHVTKGEVCFFLLGCCLLPEAFQNSSDSSHEFARGEWFRDIVVGSEFEGSNLVVLVIAGRKHDDWCAACFSDLFAYRKTIFFWEIQIEDYEIYMRS